MTSSAAHPDKRLQAARTIFEHIAQTIDARFSVQLWDGSVIPLGSNVDTDFYLSISGPGVIGSILRRPTLENILRHYANGQIGFHGGDLIAFGEAVRAKRAKDRLRGLSKSLIIRQALPLLLTPPDKAELQHGFDSEVTGRQGVLSGAGDRKNKDFIQFHYDVSNEFYALWLDPEMQYSCAYFTDWDNTLEQAQIDKLEMICRKLRLQPGDRFLDIGCGWGGLVCYAAQHFGVKAHGVTLSQRQLDFAQEKVNRLGLQDSVKLELRDYITLDGEYDKISSIGMFEHIGIANFPTYFGRVFSLLRDRGIFLNHGIARKAKVNKRNFKKITPEKRLILKYIFPGSELDHIGHTLESMEACGFEIHDVEAWREHYALATKIWCQRLSARREEAVELVGEERYRLWVAYLAAVSFNFTDGPLRINQVVATKHAAKGVSKMPPTRRDLYEREMPSKAENANG